MICPSCTTTLPERGFYCPSCAVPVRCKQCNEVLEHNARACVMCGSAIGNGTSGSTNGHSAAINTFELQEDLKSRTVRLHLTDEAVGHVGDALTAVFADRAGNRPRPTARVFQHHTISEQTLELPAPTSERVGVPAAPPRIVPSTPTSGDQERLRHIFEYVGDEIRLEEDRLKADSRQEYARRLTYLFLYAHELEGRKPLPYANLKKILETARLWEDANVRHALTHKMAIEIENDHVRLKKAGRESAITALNEILNPANPAPGWTPDASAKPTKPADGKDTKGTGKRGRKRSNQPEEWAKSWKKHPDHLNGHFALKGRTLQDKALLGLWAIHKAGGTAASAAFLQRFIKEAFELDENERSIANTLGSPKSQTLFLKTDGGYKLTSSGTKQAEAIAKK